MNPSNDNTPQYMCPADAAYALKRVEQIVREESVIEALIERGLV